MSAGEWGTRVRFGNSGDYRLHGCRDPKAMAGGQHNPIRLHLDLLVMGNREKDYPTQPELGKYLFMFNEF